MAGRPSEELGVGRVLRASPFMIRVLLCRDIEYTDLTLSCISTCLVFQAQPEPSDGTRSWQRELSRIRHAVTSVIGVSGIGLLIADFGSRPGDRPVPGTISQGNLEVKSAVKANRWQLGASMLIKLVFFFSS